MIVEESEDDGCSNLLLSDPHRPATTDRFLDAHFTCCS